MDERTDMGRLMARLDGLESSLRHVKNLLWAIFMLLLVGFLGIDGILGLSIWFVVGAVLLALVGYAVLWFFWGIVRLKYSPSSELDLEKAVLDEPPADTQR